MPEENVGQTPRPKDGTTRPLTIPDMVGFAEGIRSARGNDPEFQRRVLEATNEALILIGAVSTGEMSEDAAAQVIGAMSAEAQLAREEDYLTGLPDRGGLERRLAEVFAIAKRNGLGIAVAFADLDNFKAINDLEEKGGHARGDAVLSAWGGAIRASFRRETDFAGRYGGEEIVFVFVNADEAWATEHLRELAQNMPDSISEAVLGMGFELDASPTMTVGIVDAKLDPQDPRDPMQIATDLIKQADQRMYLGKTSGRNTIVDSTQERLIRERQVK